MLGGKAVLRVVNVEPPTAAAVVAPPTASAPTPVSPSMSSKGCGVQDDSEVKKCATKAAVCDILQENMQSFTLGKGK